MAGSKTICILMYNEDKRNASMWCVRVMLMYQQMMLPLYECIQRLLDDAALAPGMCECFDRKLFWHAVLSSFFDKQPALLICLLGLLL